MHELECIQKTWRLLLSIVSVDPSTKRETIVSPVLRIQICDLSSGSPGYIVPTSSMYRGDTQPIVEFDWERILVYKRERVREYYSISQRLHVIERTTTTHCCVNTTHCMLCSPRHGTRQHMGRKIPFRRIPVLVILVRFTHGQNLSFGRRDTSPK